MKKIRLNTRTTRFLNCSIAIALLFFFFACQQPPGRRTVKEPTFRPPSRQVLTSDLLRIRTITSDATIYYTLDGSDPTTSSILYEDEDPVSFDTIGVGDVTVTAIATKPGFNNSRAAAAVFTVSTSIDAPTFTFTPGPGGAVRSTDSLMISSSTYGANVHYTTDDSEPNAMSDQFTEPRSFGSLVAVGDEPVMLTIKAIAIVGEGATALTSMVIEQMFTIVRGTIADPTFRVLDWSGAIKTDDITAATGTVMVLTSDRLVMRSATLGAGFRYALGTDLAPPSTPSDSDPMYMMPLSFGDASLGVGTHVISAIATGPGEDSMAVEVTFAVQLDVDADNDGLIEINNLEMLNNIRYNLAGTTYDDEDADTGAGDVGVTQGAPANEMDRAENWACEGRPTTTELCGYELTQNLDFDTQVDYGSIGATHFDNAWDATDWRPHNGTTRIQSNIETAATSSFGFPGIGPATGDTNGFTAIFEGNGFTISKLYSRAMDTGSENAGLFRVANTNAIIRNLGVTAANVYGGTGNDDRVGILVGFNEGTVLASHSSGEISTRGGTGDSAGGLVGENNGTMRASYSQAAAAGGAGGMDNVGGLVGTNGSTGTIQASFATGSATGGADASDDVGGLVGNNAGTIVAAYASGNPVGGTGNTDEVGGLAGNNSGTITASYATGNPDPGSETGDMAGKLTGTAAATGITASYGFGTVTGAGGFDGTTVPTGVTGPNAENLLAGDNTDMATYAGDAWNDAAMGSAGAWNFGSNSQRPALVYNDYDGNMMELPACDENNGGFLGTVPGDATATLTCGTTIVGGTGSGSPQGRN